MISTETRPLPTWFRQELPNMTQIREIKKIFRDADLHTICESAKCPNMGQCWEAGVATFMILGNVCTRACRFCNVADGAPLDVNGDEPQRIAQTIKAMQLRYVVITSVTRDDLADGGAQHFCETIAAIRQTTPQTKIEVLIPDFQGKKESFKKVIEAQPDVISHNIETVHRLSSSVRPQADYDRSLSVLEMIKSYSSSMITKSGLMVGMGETDDEIRGTIEDLSKRHCDILTMGQYLAPTQQHWSVDRYVSPEEFKKYQQWALGLGFRSVLSAPLARSSFLAEKGFIECVKKY